MVHITDCSIGFADGQIDSYYAHDDVLVVVVEFWNAKRASISFQEPVVMHDNGAIGMTLSSAKEIGDSPLIADVLGRLYDNPPGECALVHYQFLGVDGNPVLEVVAKSCSIACENHDV